jgi:two-component system response regulator FixJ
MNRVFLIEDDQLMREVVARSLAKGGIDVVQYCDAAAAIDAIVDTPPALVITDVHMPRMTGVELVREMRARGSSVSVIMISAHVSDAEMDEARALGVVRMFRKPIGDMSRLLMAVEQELAGEGADTLDRLDSLRLEVLTNLSHELRTPLTATRLAMDGLLSQIEPAMDAPQKRLAAISMRNIDRLVALIERHLLTLHEQVRVDGDRVVLEDGVVTVSPGLAPDGRRRR